MTSQFVVSVFQAWFQISFFVFSISYNISFFLSSSSIAQKYFILKTKFDQLGFLVPMIHEKSLLINIFFTVSFAIVS